MISKFFINRPRFAMVISIVITLSGIMAIFSLPISLYPEVSPPEVQITASYPGASADVVRKTIIEPIESQVNGVKNMIYMTSSASNDGTASITVTFAIGTDGNMNTVNVQNRVALATPTLPEEVKSTGVSVKEKSSNMLMVINIYSPEGTYDDLFLNNFALLNIRDDILRIPGVGDLEMLGGSDYSMRIWLNPDRLASLKISPAEVIAAINEQNVQVAAGQIGTSPIPESQQLQYTIQTKGRLSDINEFKNIIIRANQDGSDVRLKDVAKVELGAKDYSSWCKLDGKFSAALAVYQLSNANALDVAEKVNEKLKKLSERFPKDIAYSTCYDTTRFIKASLEEVVETLFIAILLVILVVNIFLQEWRATLVPGIAIPVSLIGTFAVMLALGFTINMTTMFGLILAIGIVVDDAIIVIENVFRLMHEENLPPKKATIKTMEQVTSPIVATTLVLMSVFIPVSFLPGITGELYRQFALTISFSVGISAINALTLSPALCAILLKPGEKKHFILFRLFNKFFTWLTNIYLHFAGIFIHRSKLTVIFFIMLIGLSCFIYTKLPTGFLPTEDQGFILIDVMLPDAASINRTEKVVNHIYNIVKNTPGVKNVITVTGFSMFLGSSASNGALVIAVLDDWSKRKTPELSQTAILHKFYGSLMMGIPSAQVIPFELPAIMGLGIAGGFDFMLQDTRASKPQELASVMDAVVDEANKQPELSRVSSTFRASVPQYYLEIDREKVKKLGISLSEVFTTLQATLGSAYVNDFNKFGKVYQVKIQSDQNYRTSMQDINSLYVKNAKGEMIPLDTILSIKTTFAPQVLKRYNMYSAAEITGSASPGYSSGDAIKTMEKVAKKVLPEGMTFEWTGISYQEIVAGSKALMIFALCIIFAYLFLTAQYESWMLPLAVMFSVPVAFLGALLILWLCGLDNNIYTQIGFVLLVGLAAKTAIIIVEFAAEQHRDGKNIIDAAIAAGKLRFRAVCMTVFAFVLGVIPLVFASGAGAASRRSLGTAVFGGMLLAGVLGTIIIPAFYVIIQSIREWCHSKVEKYKYNHQA